NARSLDRRCAEAPSGRVRRNVARRRDRGARASERARMEERIAVSRLGTWCRQLQGREWGGASRAVSQLAEDGGSTPGTGRGPGQLGGRVSEVRVAQRPIAER